MDKLEQKFINLKNLLASYKSALIAFSGGVDSALLLAAAQLALREKVLAVTIKSAVNPPGELDEARKIARMLGVEHLVIEMDPLAEPSFYTNPPDRCYHCKKKMMAQLLEVAAARKLNNVLDGANVDDTKDYRPGLKASLELGIKQPLLEVGLTKQEIRELSRQMNLPTADRPSAACLASRIPYGTTITTDALHKIAGAEVFLHGYGFNQVRVRYHGDLARIEVPQGQFNQLTVISKQVTEHFKKLGFNYVSLDLQGYRTGSMNEGL